MFIKGFFLKKKVLNNKNTSFSPRSKNFQVFGQYFFGYFIIHVQLNTLVVLDKTKKSGLYVNVFFNFNLYYFNFLILFLFFL